ncbi:MAG: hypothetical protein ACWGOX_08715 [Desulforhopalus sp.]
MKITTTADFCYLDPEVERRAELLAAGINTVSQLVELQAQREIFESGRRAANKEEEILSQAFYLATKRMGLV